MEDITTRVSTSVDSDAPTPTSDKALGGKVKKLPVIEIFGPTLQGEGAIAGTRTTFIRFGLCDYKCTMCDSMHAVDPQQVRANATYMTPEEIVEALVPYHELEHATNCDWVTFSGGNPCIHNLEELIKRIRGLNLTHGDIKISVETQGTFQPKWLHWCESVCVSPKGPGMGEIFEPDKFMDFVMGFKHHKGFYCKVVIFSEADLEFAEHINEIMVTENLGDRMYLSLGNPYPPGKNKEIHYVTKHDHFVDGDDALCLQLMNNMVSLTEDLLKHPHMRNVKFFPQMHVLMWGNKQGV